MPLIKPFFGNDTRYFQMNVNGPRKKYRPLLCYSDVTILWYLAYSWTYFRRGRLSRSGNDLGLLSFSIQFQLLPVQLSPNWLLSYKYRRTIFWKLDVDSSRKSPEIPVKSTGLSLRSSLRSTFIVWGRRIRFIGFNLMVRKMTVIYLLP